MTQRYCDKCGRLISDSEPLTYIDCTDREYEFTGYELCKECSDEVIALIEGEEGNCETL